MNATTQSQTLSHYRLTEILGRGAMGEVWLAEDLQLPRQVAIKLLPRHLADDREAVDRLLREAQAAASIDHPAVVTVYEAGLADGRPYLVMQKVEGETLDRRIARGPLPVDEVIALALKVADALAEVHAVGVIHRDLKPSNLLLTPRGPKILDFGVASVKGSTQLTSSGTVVGSPCAMSPEQMQGLPADNRSDLWSLGVLLYEALTGKAPFQAESLEALAYQLAHVQPDPPSTLRPEVGRDLEYAVMKLLRKNPAHRYARAEDLIADLQSCCSVPDLAADAPPEKPAVTRIAVLPFEVMSADPDDAFVAAGLVDDLIVDLARVRDLRVSSRAEVLPYRERAAPVRTIARELGVDMVVLGSVRRAGTRARIGAQVVRAADGQVVWAERFDRTLDDLFEVQAEVSKSIVEALELTLRPGEKEMLARAPTRSGEAYAFYLKGRDLILGGRDDNLRAEALLERAIEIDSEFALGHAVLAQCLATRAFRWWAGAEVAERALPHARRALELEPGLMEALEALTMIHRIEGHSPELLEMLERLTALDPDNELTLEWLGWTYLSLGRPEQGVAVLESAVARHPDNHRCLSFLSLGYETLGRGEESEALRARTLEAQLETLRRQPDDVLTRAQLAISLIQAGRVDAGLEQIQRAVAMSPDDGRIRYNAACAYARAGQNERAIDELRAGIQSISAYLTDWPLRDPDLASLHGHPEFVRMFGQAKG